MAPGLDYSAEQIERMRKYLDEARQYCVRELRTRASIYQKGRQRLQADLKRRTASLEDPKRRDLHCKIQNLRIPRKPGADAG